MPCHLGGGGGFAHPALGVGDNNNGHARPPGKGLSGPSYRQPLGRGTMGPCMDNSPRHMAKLNLAVPAGLPGLMAGIEGQWISSRLGNAGSESLPSYTLANLNLHYAPAASRWDIALSIYNLFDRRYSDPVAVDDLLPTTRWQLPQQGRS